MAKLKKRKPIKYISRKEKLVLYKSCSICREPLLGDHHIYKDMILCNNCLALKQAYKNDPSKPYRRGQGYKAKKRAYIVPAIAANNYKRPSIYTACNICQKPLMAQEELYHHKWVHKKCKEEAIRKEKNE